MKGIVAIKDEPNRFIFQGVHMLFEAREGKAWSDEKPFNRMVFIGRELNKSLIEGAFRSCLL
jgi:G3E family GTPase